MYNPKPFHRKIALILLMIFIPSLLPVNLLYASNNGPNAPEAQGFEPVNATDMVNLSSGDMSYVLPVMEVDGFPVTLSYHGGIPLDLESSWVGLGWNLNTGAINRGLNATPDDWKGGKSLDFLRFQDAETIYTVNVGIGISQCLEAGVGMSMSSHKGVSGSVYAQASLYGYVGVGGSVDTNGNYSANLMAGYMGGGNSYSVGAGVGVSGNFNGGKTNYSLGVGGSVSGLKMGMSTSLTGNGTSFSMGYGNSNAFGGLGAAGSASISMSDFSQGDWDISSKGWYIPIQIYCFTLGFGKRKTTYSLKRSYAKEGYGILYNDSNANATDSKTPDYVFTDYQNRFVYGDMYEQALPQPEKEFIGDYDLEREKLNFSFAGYDNYGVNATGISGQMTPVVFNNATLFGMGYIGDNPRTSDPEDKQRVYYHKTNNTKRLTGANPIFFNFEGQFTTNNVLQPLLPSLNTNIIYNTVANNLTAKPATVSPRFQQGNYVEVFTNSQIVNGQSGGLLNPESLPNNKRTQQNSFIPEGIGGYKITAPDGKVYHFSLPVYHFEMVNRHVLKDDSEEHVNEKRQYTPYATHWLLTAITGPDYFDINNNNIADEEDYGYWIRLEHGKWSDGYVWRTPTDKNLKDYTTNIESKIGKDDFGNYQFGRKQLYYLDKIVSKQHTAYFVKDLRYDSVGSDLTYSFTSVNDIANYGFGANSNQVYEKGIHYKKQMQLKLKKIVLVKNSDADVFENSVSQTSNPLSLNIANVPDYFDNYNLELTNGGGFANVYSGGVNPLDTNQILHNVKVNQEQNVIDVKDFEAFDYSKAIKVVEFEHNYNLAVKDHNHLTEGDNFSNGSPGVIQNTLMNPNHGKLTLKKVKFLGRNNFDYMPPYQFDYDGEFINQNSPYVSYPKNAIAQRKGLNIFSESYNGEPIGIVDFETPITNIRAKDEWGFRKERPEAWTLTSITTPTGAKMEFEHEEDDYHTEAFSRRYWMQDLKFKASDLGDSILIEIRNDNGLLNITNNFHEYFEVGETVYLDLWLSRRFKEYCGFLNTDTCTRDGNLDVNSNNNSYVAEVGADYVKIITNELPGTLYGNRVGHILNDYFSQNGTTSGSHVYYSMPRGEQPPLGTSGGFSGIGGLPDHWTISYKLLANKVPKDETGGGLRVKSITLNDENNNFYKTSYYYNVPGTNKNKNVGNYKSSGITSYSPVKGLKFVPYQSELPSPGVMYEYVTMVTENSLGQNLGEMRYRFYVLRPVLDIFNENIVMKYDDGTNMFKANVYSHNVDNGYFDSNPLKKTKSKSIDVKVNTSLIGQFRSVAEYNNKGQLMTKSEKHYLSGDALKTLADLGQNYSNKQYRGVLKESFQSMKSIYNVDENDNNPVIDKRLLSLSSREDQTSVLTSMTKVTPFGKSTEFYKGSDPMTGTFNIIEKQKADGKWSRIERIPAYTKYPSMGSKVDNINNKNMLTQETASISSVKIDNSWKTIGASITTWNEDWKYRDESTGLDVLDLNHKVWRKHKNFVLKSRVSSSNDYNGIVIGVGLTKNNIDNSFDWSLSQPILESWEKVSEITRYTRWSSPIETKDINGNFASTKMCDKDSKVLVSGNARYTEMYYSGAEYVKDGNLFDGEVKGADFRSQEVAHTGKYSVKCENVGDHVFEVNGTSGDANYYSNQDNYFGTFRPGKYKASFWALSQGSPKKCAELLVNGVSIPVSEIVEAGCWQQFNYYFDIPANNQNNTIVVTSSQVNGYNFYDDFRIHPISSSLNTYVYDQNTDQLSYMLDSNNIGSAYKYDDAGRLSATYTEVLDNRSFDGVYTEGGFKLVSQYRQKYKGANDVVTNALPKIDNCYTVLAPLQVNIKNECVGSFDNRFHIYPEGGSGNYTYQYKWKTNVANNTFTNYVNGTNIVYIPYVPKYCTVESFDKMWSFVVKVTDLTTGQFIEQPYEYTVGNCNFRINSKQWADVEISKCKDFCGTGEYTFQVHLKDIGYQGNFKYEWASYDPTDPNIQNHFYAQSLNWIDVTQVNGKFCPPYRLAVDNSCPFGFRKMYYFTYRITNLDTGEKTFYEPIVFVGDCVNDCSLCKEDYIPKEELQYLKEGNIIIKDDKGTSIKEVYNINETLK